MADLLCFLQPALGRLLPANARIVVATSGGPDSQALLDLLARARPIYQWEALWAVGIDHGLRPAAAQELAAAAALAARHAIPFETIAVQVAPSGNRLANARQARYAALRAAAARLGASHIALGHTATDQLETIVQRLCRGCGLRGAAGMRPRRGMLVRPLLHVSRAALQAYGAARGLACAHDPTNDDPQRTRTQVRCGVLPVLQHINRAAEGHFAAFAAFAQEDEQCLQLAARRRLRRAQTPSGGLPQAALRATPAALGRRMLRLWMTNQGFGDVPGKALAAVWAGRHAAGPAAWSCGRGVVRAERGVFWRVEQGLPQNLPAPRKICIPGKTPIPGFSAWLVGERSSSPLVNRSQLAQWGAEGVAFDADRLHFELRLRVWQLGDTLRPFGMDGVVNVGDLFTNAKIPRALRARWPMVVHGDEVVWVVGLRRGSAAPVELKQTRRIITLELDGALLWSAC